MPELSEKENDFSFLTHDLMVPANNNNSSAIINQSPTNSSDNSPKPNSSSPLSQSNKRNSASPFRKKLHHKAASIGPTDPVSSENIQRNVLQDDYNALERQLANSLLKYNTLQGENTRLEHELSTKSAEFESVQEKLKRVEDLLHESQFENAKHEDVLHKQIEMYKDMVDSLQVKIITLSDELELNKKLQIESAIHDQSEISEKYHKLVRDYKILARNFEVEKTSKSALMEEIELLLREKDDLQNKIENVASRYSEDLISHHDFDFDQPTHDMTHLSDDEFPIEAMLPEQSHGRISLLDDIIHSSPIKYEDCSQESVHVDTSFQFPARKSIVGSPNLQLHHRPVFDAPIILNQFNNNQFPPSPDPNSKKRQSLPTSLKRMTHIEENSEFVLSPFKLQPSNEHRSSRSHNSSPLIPSANKRHSAGGVKSGHTRYNSHDIIPISIEFEKVDDSNGLRSISMPESSASPLAQEHPSSHEQYHKSRIEQYRDEALLALSGYEEVSGDNTVRHSEDTASSSKRSSYIADDKTRQEIMKLKFELQSLKLHNEKLLSYIGFELQKQKKNIKRLTKKQSQQTLLATAVSGSPSRKIEYSDAKLIESSRDILINKKRVLRSVSINAILGKNYNRYPSDHDTPGEFGDVRSSYSSPTYVDQGRDIYDELYDIDDEAELEGLEQQQKTLKKYASEVFSKPGLYSLAEDDTDDEIDGEDDEDDDDVQDSTWQEDMSSQYTSDEEIGMLNQIRYLVMGNMLYGGKKNKKKKDQHLVDDGLKFKFLTIALGIAIIAIKLTPQHRIGASD
ncbi:hypothetical protein JA1_004326 [Spathaspora sp. JA1]|nr:hypothetical protein JA1_004326 [Spathaspora sp. JA1]